MPNIQLPALSFRERCAKEATANVIFLLQVPDYIMIGYPYSDDGEYCHDGEGVILGDVNEQGLWVAREDAEYLTDKELMEMTTCDDVPCLLKRWRTSNVFLSREEAEEWAQANAHNLRDGYQVYGVCAVGALAELLKET